VPGVRVGHVTVIDGYDIRTGVTAVVHDTLLKTGTLPAGLAVRNGFGKMAGDGPVPGKDLDLLFLAAIEATEEAILNSLFMAVTTTGVGGHTRQAVPLDYVRDRVTGRSAGRSAS
jgi:L-aminopeptidase/D-esterase-like protein